MDPDQWGQKTCGSDGSGFGSGTLEKTKQMATWPYLGRWAGTQYSKYTIRTRTNIVMSNCIRLATVGAYANSFYLLGTGTKFENRYNQCLTKLGKLNFVSVKTLGYRVKALTQLWYLPSVSCTVWKRRDCWLAWKKSGFGVICRLPINSNSEDSRDPFPPLPPEPIIAVSPVPDWPPVAVETSVACDVIVCRYKKNLKSVPSKVRNTSLPRCKNNKRFLTCSIH